MAASSLTVAVERLWGEDTNAKGYPREVIAQVLAMAELGYSATDISREFRGNPSVDTVRKWIQQARLLGLNPSPDEMAQAQRLIAEAARQRVFQMQNRFGSWAFMLVDELFTATEMAAKILRKELEKVGNADKVSKDSLHVIRQMTGTIHYLVGDVSLLAGKPTERQAQVISTEEEAEAPVLPPEELAQKMRELANSIEESARPKEAVA